MTNKIKSFLNKGSVRSVQAKKNILGSFINKIFSVIITLLIVPLTINYVNKEQYGIWLTISSIISWASYFDLGLANGFRFRFAEAKAVEDIELVRKYVSTTYFSLGILFSIIAVMLLIANHFILWSNFLAIDSKLDIELHYVFNILIFSFCSQMVLKTFTTLLLADQRPALSSLVLTIGQFFVLLTIFLLTKNSASSLIKLAFAISVVPNIVLLFISIIGFSSFYKSYLPHIKYFSFKVVSNIIGLGLKFFLIQVSLLIIFQFTYVIIIRNLGEEYVSYYDTSYKYFSLVYLIANIVLLPFWSAFTDAYAKNDYIWMKSVYKKLNFLFLLAIPIVIIMIVIHPYVYNFWLGSKIQSDYLLAVFMGLYILVLTRSSITLQLINGIGKISLQLYIYCFFAIISIPLMTYISVHFGLYGILLYLSIVYLSQLLIGHLQLLKLLNSNAFGLWNR